MKEGLLHIDRVEFSLATHRHMTEEWARQMRGIARRTINGDIRLRGRAPYILTVHGKGDVLPIVHAQIGDILRVVPGTAKCQEGENYTCNLEYSPYENKLVCKSETQTDIAHDYDIKKRQVRCHDVEKFNLIYRAEIPMRLEEWRVIEHPLGAESQWKMVLREVVTA